MSEPTIVSGKLISTGEQQTFPGFRVVALFQEMIVLTESSLSATALPVFLPSRRTAAAREDGTFSIALPSKEKWEGPLSLYAEGTTGLRLGEKDVPTDATENIEIQVRKEPAPEVVVPGDDPAQGKRIKFTGRAIDTQGNALPAGPLVVFWGVAPGQPEESRFPVAIADLGAGGYFSGTWPPDILGSVFARIGEGDAIAVTLENERFPLRVILVAAPGQSNGGTLVPPRAPDNIDLSSNPEAFSVDPKPCVNFTVPNRTVEEVTYQALVRTTQPEVQAAPRPRPQPVPPRLLDHIVNLASRYTEFEQLTQQADVNPAPGDPRTRIAVDAPAFSRINTSTGTDPLSEAMRSVSSLALDASTATRGASADDVAARVLSRRDLQKNPLRFESSVLAEMAQQPGPITPRKILQAEQTSTVRRFRSAIGCMSLPLADRFHPGADRQVNWEASPVLSQASTIAHGHLLTIKQVWRSDGYSLGDLLYSLPLAPGQQKLISILDWERREIAMRAETRRVTEDLNASLLHDRDISEIVRSSLSERMDASSRAHVRAAGGAFGGFVGAVVFGAAGGVSSAGSTANQVSSRDVAASVLNLARDRTMQGASAVRSQRSTVVQTARQGETVRAQTEVIANYNHCHALTIEYFEVLRHLQVSQEIAHVQECLFIPLRITPFNRDKALAWRASLQAAIRDRRFLPYFDALERVVTDWQKADFPLARYADERLTHLDGEFRVRVSIPRPADTSSHTFDQNTWEPFRPLLAQEPRDVWERYLGVALPEQRAGIWNTRIAPGIVQRLFNFLRVELGVGGGSFQPVDLDVTLVTEFRQNAELLMSFRPTGGLPAVTRAQVDRVRISFAGIIVPAGVEAIINSGSMHYRTDHINHHLFRDHRVLNDLLDAVVVLTPMDRHEKRNPRETDRRQTDSLLDHLNRHLEYYTRAPWSLMDPNRRLMLLDGVIAPNAGGRSVATVVENRVIGIVGNCLVMPVAPGIQLDSTYRYAERTPAELRDLYSTNPPEPVRVSLPTRGVFAEAVLGKCNSCEVIDDTVFWRWEEAPIPDSPTAIDPISTAPRDVAPVNVRPSDFQTGIVRLQQTPSAPDPTGMEAALQALGIGNIFRDMTGLQANQAASAAALDSAMGAARTFASHGLQIAQQRFLNSQMDRATSFVKQARDKKLMTPEKAKEVTADLFRRSLGMKKPDEKAPTETEGVKSFLERISEGVSSAAVRIARPSGILELLVGPNAKTSPVAFAVQPAVPVIVQDSPLTCWAAAGAMMASWKGQTHLTIDAALADLGGQWLAAYKAGDALTIAELKAFASVLGLKEEASAIVTVEAMLNLLQNHGPLWVIADDSIENNKLVHARIVTALNGDSSAEGTEVTFIDSAKGEVPPESFKQFVQKMTSGDAANLGVSMLHF